MSQFQQLVLNSTEQTNPTPSLTGCVYHVIQGVGLPGQNVLKLIPVSKPASNLIPVFQQPVFSGISAQKLAVLPPVLSNSSLPAPVTLPVLQQPAFGNYIITANNSLPESAKTVRVEQTTSPLQNATLVLENPHVSVPSSVPQQAAPTFVMVKPTPAVVTVNSTPMLPSGHHLQIPANAEVKSVPASSLPIAIQQKIITAASRGDVNRNPSVIYVSPVNTVRTLAMKPLSPLSPKTTTPAPAGIMVPAPKSIQSTAESPNAPMKWIVQQNRESAACLVPVKSSNDTASKILKLLSGAQNDQNNLANVLPAYNSPAGSTTKAINVKDNALVMYNNKIYLLAKRGSEVFDSEAKKPALSNPVSPEKLVSNPDPIKDISNKVVEVVLSKNKTSGSYGNQQTGSTVENPTQNLNIKQTFTPNPLQGNVAVTNGISVNNDSITEKDLIIPRSPEQDRIPTTPKLMAAVNLNCVKDEPEDPVPIAQTNQIQRLTTPFVKLEKTSTPVTPSNDKILRLKFGLIKKEKVILRRLPLLQAQTSSKDQVAVGQNWMKRKSTSEPAHQLKRRKSLDESVLRQDFAPAQSNNSNSLPSTTSRPLSAGSLRAASVPPVTVGSVSSLPFTSRTPASPSVQIKNPNPLSSPPEQNHSDESSSQSNSEPAPPSQYFPTIAPVYFDDTIRDEKIRRLKELLKEREQELEAIRKQMRT